MTLEPPTGRRGGSFVDRHTRRVVFEGRRMLTAGQPCDNGMEHVASSLFRDGPHA